jgi:diguanylate cyclase (GGDEF)-like protein/PAS domain S-box-containing protein
VGILVSGVLAWLIQQHDYRLVLLAVLLNAATAFVAFRLYSNVKGSAGPQRIAWLFLTGLSTAAGIWATHIVAMLAYDSGLHSGLPTKYDPVLTLASLLVAAVTMTAGFALSARTEGAPGVAGGGAVLGAGIGAMHYTGMQAVIVPGTLSWDMPLVCASLLVGSGLTALAMVAYANRDRKRAPWLAVGLLTSAICGLHVTAAEAFTVIPDPAAVMQVSAIDGSLLAVGAACAIVLLMLTALAAALIESQADRASLARIRELVDAAFEGLVLARDGLIVDVNQRVSELSGWPSDSLVGKRILSDLICGSVEADLIAGPVMASLRTASGAMVPVEVSCRPLTNSIRGNQVYAIRDIRHRQTSEQQLKEQNRALKVHEEELEAYKAQIVAALEHMSQGVCLFDANQRVVIANRRYAQMYDLPLELVRPGTTLRQILEARAAKGFYDNDRARQWVESGLSTFHKEASDVLPLSDGRFICVLRRPVAGGGIVSTHEDVTEREKLRERLHTALNTMAQGLAMFDADERIVIANDRFAEMYGMTPEQVKPGTTLREIVEARKANGHHIGETVDQTLEVMRGRRAKKRVLHHINRTGDGRVIAVTIQPRTDGGWVATHNDITERERLMAQLAQQKEQLDIALNNMSQGLAMYDAQNRLVVCNRLYYEMYGLTAEQVKPGMTIREVFEQRIAKGNYSEEDAEHLISTWVEDFGESSTRTQKLRDGRIIIVSRKRTADGGRVVTHEDVTERERLHARLEEQHGILKQQEEILQLKNLHLDTALNNMAHGLAMFDADGRLVVCNRLYYEMYGLTAEQIRPGMTAREILELRFATGLYGDFERESLLRLVADSQQEFTQLQELADGRVISMTRRNMPNGGHLITHEDITERHWLHAQLNEQKDQLDAALNNMVQGLAMFDSNLRLVVANVRYAEIYGLTQEQVKPGTTLRQIIAHRAANGHLDATEVDQVLRSVLRPEQDGLRSGYWTTRLRNGRYIAVSVREMANGGWVSTHQDITEQRQSEAKIAHMALHDALTGLPNRVLLSERLEQALARAKRGEIVATHLLDLDHFKNVNDTLGHPAGDKLLKTVAERLRSLVRETDTIARMGGDEFAIIQLGIEQPSQATSLAERVIALISEPYEFDGNQVIIGTSVGIAIAPADGDTPDQVIRNADLALYRAKGEGRATFCFFEPEMDAQMQARRALEYDMRKALHAGEFELYYQPIINIKSNDISGFEALIRWRHPTKGIVPPSDFIRLAEEIGFIVPLGEWAIRQACATAASWPAHVKIAVNLSPAQFRSPGLVDIVVGALAASGLPPERLELEITETVLLENNETTLAVLYELRELGVRVAMDDFGTGYSSLSYLQSFPFDKIKIDRSFIKDISDGTGSLNIVRAVTALANGLGMSTTAEGVETKEQLETVRAEGCTEIQGFYFSKPRPAHEIEELFLRKYRDASSAVDSTDAGAVNAA